MVKQCVSIWFGSTGAFEEHVRSNSRAAHRMSSAEAGCCKSQPRCCGDSSASAMQTGDWDLVFEFNFIALVLWLLLVPLLLEKFFFLSRGYCSKTSCGFPCSDLFLKLGIWLVSAFVAGIFGAIYLLIRFARHRDAWIRSPAWAGATYSMAGAMSTML